MTAVIFDVGGVLVDWNPRYLYRKLFDGDEAGMERFLTHVCSMTWTLMQDAGRPFADGVAALAARYPEHAELIAAYDARWDEMVAGAFDEVVALVGALEARGVPLYALTNFSVEKFTGVRRRFDVFDAFDGIVVSGAVGLVKPDPAIYLRLVQDHGLRPAACLFIDDSPINVAGAEAVGIAAHRFRGAPALRAELERRGLL